MQFSNLNLDYFSILPEIMMALAGVLVMMLDAFSKNGARRTAPVVSLIALVAAMFPLFGMWSASTSSSFSGMIVTDHLRIYFAIIILICGIISTLLASQFLDNEALPSGEFIS